MYNCPGVLFFSSGKDKKALSILVLGHIEKGGAKIHYSKASGFRRDWRQDGIYIRYYQEAKDNNFIDGPEI